MRAKPARRHPKFPTPRAKPAIKRSKRRLRSRPTHQAAKGLLNMQVTAGATWSTTSRTRLAPPPRAWTQNAPQLPVSCATPPSAPKRLADLRDQTVEDLIRMASEFHPQAACARVRPRPPGRLSRLPCAQEQPTKSAMEHDPMNNRFDPMNNRFEGRTDSSMAHDRLRDSGLVQALTDLFADLADLLQKELQLAKTEITEKLVSRLRASVWMVVAGVLGLIAILLLIEAAVFGIASFGIALHWSCLIVAGVLMPPPLRRSSRAGRRRGRASPTRSAKQISQDLR